MANRKFDKKVNLGSRKVGFTLSEWDILCDLVRKDVSGSIVNPDNATVTGSPSQSAVPVTFATETTTGN